MMKITTTEKFDKMFPRHRIISVKELYKKENVKEDIYLGRHESDYYHFLEKNQDKAYTFWALMEGLDNDEEINPIPTMSSMLDYDSIQKTLEKMIKEGKIKGVYAEGHY
ncbi:MAG: hypothetical protein ACFFDN_20700 [Candidatus Hodarchaeota archaeon]